MKIEHFFENTTYVSLEQSCLCVPLQSVVDDASQDDGKSRDGRADGNDDGEGDVADLKAATPVSKAVSIPSQTCDDHAYTVVRENTRKNISTLSHHQHELNQS